MSLRDLFAPPVVKPAKNARVVRADRHDAPSHDDPALEKQRKWRAENREEYNARMREYMRARYAKKKAAGQ